jgi:hypothetical protein
MNSLREAANKNFARIAAQNGTCDQLKARNQFLYGAALRDGNASRLISILGEA